MLQNIREKSQSWFATLIIVLICLSFALWGIHNYVTESKPHEAAIVNGHSISLKDVDQQYERLKQQQLAALDNKSNVLPLSLDMQLKMKALDLTITQQALSDAAIKQGFFIGNAQLQKVLMSIPVFQINGVFNQQRFHEVLKDVNYLPNVFIQDLKKALMLEQVRKGFINSAFVMPEDGERAIRLIEQRRDIRYMVIFPSRFQNTIQITSKELENYFNKHPQQFILSEKLKVAYVTLNLNDIKSRIRIQPTEIKEYYQQNIATFEKPKRWHFARIQIVIPNKGTKAEQDAAMQKIQMINKDLKNGTDFSKVARKYSDDVISARMGGEFGWFTENNFDKSLRKASLHLKKAGDISLPIQNTHDVTIYKLLEVEEKRTEPFIAVAEEIEHNLINEKAEKQFYDDRELLNNTAFANPHSLDSAASTLGLPVHISEWFSKTENNNNDQLLQNPVVTSAAFSPDVLANKNNSQVLEISPEQIMVLRVIAYQKPTIKPFSKVAAEIHKILAEEKAKQQTLLLGKRIINLLQEGASFTKLAKQYNLKIIEQHNIQRTEKSFDPKFIEEVFKIPQPQQGIGSFHGFILPLGEYVVSELIGIKSGELTQPSLQQKNFIDNQLESGFGQLDYTFYVQSCIKSANIEIKNHSPIREING